MLPSSELPTIWYRAQHEVRSRPPVYPRIVEGRLGGLDEGDYFFPGLPDFPGFLDCVEAPVNHGGQLLLVFPVVTPVRFDNDVEELINRVVTMLRSLDRRDDIDLPAAEVAGVTEIR